MSITIDFSTILEHAHYWNWLPDWDIAKEIYQKFPESYSVLTPFAYSYLEELIRSTTSDYGMKIPHGLDVNFKHKVGKELIALAIKENKEKNRELAVLLEEKIKPYFALSQVTDSGNNRNSVDHGYIHPRFWSKESFEQLIHDIALLSEYAGF